MQALISLFLLIAGGVPVFAETSYTYFVWKSYFPYNVSSDKFEIKYLPNTIDFVNLKTLGKSGQRNPVYNTREIAWLGNNSLFEITPSVSEKVHLDRAENLGLIKLIQKISVKNIWDSGLRMHRTVVEYENFEKPREMNQYAVEESTP